MTITHLLGRGYFRHICAAGLLQLAAVLAAGSANAVFIDPMLPGTTEYEGWADMNFINYPGYGMFPGPDPWPAPIASNDPSSAGNAEFDKLAGNGYPSGSSVYAPFTSSTFAIYNTTTSAFDIATIVFQMDIGPGDDAVFFDGAVALNYNGGTQLLLPDFVRILPGEYPFVNPTNPEEAGTTSSWVYQWDLTGLGPITDYEIEWITHPHAQMYEFMLDTGDTYTNVVPEPSQALLLVSGIAALTLLGRRRVLGTPPALEETVSRF